MSAEEVQRVLDASAEVHEMAPVALRLAAITGARRAELAALRWCEVVDGVIAIDSASSVVREPTDVGLVTVLRDDPTKTGDRRSVALDDETVEVLGEMRVVQEPGSPWIFGDGPESPHPDRIGYWWRRARALSGIDVRWRLHDLRHWSATTALGSGYDLATVAGRLGHSDPSTTLRVYSHALTDRGSDLAATLSDALRPGEDGAYR